MLPLRPREGLGREEWGGTAGGHSREVSKCCSVLCISLPTPYKQQCPCYPARTLLELQTLSLGWGSGCISAPASSLSLVSASPLPLQIWALPLSLQDTSSSRSFSTSPMVPAPTAPLSLSLTSGSLTPPHPQLHLRGCPDLVTPHSSLEGVTRASCLE